MLQAILVNAQKEGIPPLEAADSIFLSSMLLPGAPAKPEVTGL